MHYLIERAREFGLDRLANRVLEHENVHGIIVSIDPFWLDEWNFFLMNGKDYTESLAYEYYYYRRKCGHFVSPGITTSIDLNWTPSPGHYFSENKSRLMVRIQLRPGTNPIQEQFSEYTSLIVMQEYAQVPKLAVSSTATIRPLEGGVSISESNSQFSGTLGGILKDRKNGKQYALTCGHVVSKKSKVCQPSYADDPKAGTIGTCILSKPPKPNTGVICNPRNTNAVFSDPDIALIELDPKSSALQSIINIGNVKGVTPSSLITPNMAVEFNGRTSGHNSRLITGGIIYTQEMEDRNGNLCCYKDMFELKDSSTLGLAFKRPVHGGDSGAWVTIQGSTGTEWCGMIVGENRQSGYAIFSEDIIQDLLANGNDLGCV